MRYYIIAGERSGDLHGGNLAKSIATRDKQAVMSGFGGEYMKDVGVLLDVHYSDMAFMGLVELLFNLRKISRYIRKCKESIIRFNPDVIILIDYGGFNRRIAKFGKKKGIKVFYYIPPKVWAWYQSRAHEIKANVDQLFVILPFEKDFYKKFDWDVHYVGNPVLDAVHAFKKDDDFVNRYQLPSGKPVVALLPGSRRQELKGVIPVMLGVVQRNRELQFVVAAVDNLRDELYAPLLAEPNVTRVVDEAYDLLSIARAAIVTSGTATLETALFRVPQVVVYSANPVSYFLAKMLIKVKYISLVNLIAGDEIVRELIQSNCTPQLVNSELQLLIQEGPRRQSVIEGYEKIIELLDAGGSASENAASLMVEYLNQR